MGDATRKAFRCQTSCCTRISFVLTLLSSKYSCSWPRETKTGGRKNCCTDALPSSPAFSPAALLAHQLYVHNLDDGCVVKYLYLVSSRQVRRQPGTTVVTAMKPFHANYPQALLFCARYGVERRFFCDLAAPSLRPKILPSILVSTTTSNSSCGGRRNLSRSSGQSNKTHPGKCVLALSKAELFPPHTLAVRLAATSSRHSSRCSASSSAAFSSHACTQKITERARRSNSKLAFNQAIRITNDDCHPQPGFSTDQDIVYENSRKTGCTIQPYVTRYLSMHLEV